MGEWTWMGHAAHFIGADNCRFHLATHVPGYIVSTVGEYVPSGEKEFSEIGAGRLYETFVFLARRMATGGCAACPYAPADWMEIDRRPANDARTARKNHLALCRKYARKPRRAK